MNYAEIVNLVFTILTTIVSLFYFHFIIFAIVGLFFKKKYKKAKVKHRFAVVIPARNEEKVIGNLIESLRSSDYPQDKIDIFVMAHNCTDNTAQVSRDLGVKVYEYNNDKERTKGFALKYLFDQFKVDFANGIEEYDGYFVFDADNLVSKNYFEKMNDAFEANGENAIITSYRNSKNFGSNLMSGMYGMYFLYGCRYEMRGRAAVGMSGRVYGTGHLMSSKVLKDGWPYVTLTEDWEFTADQLIDEHRIRYCDEAVMYDEQPVDFGVMWTQRVRWQKGHLQVCVTRLGKLVKNFFNPKKKYKVSTYDLMANSLPFCLLYVFLYLGQFIMLLFSPLFGLTLWPLIQAMMINLCWTLLAGYLTFALSAALLFIIERKRIPKMSFMKKAAICLVFPLFMGLQFPIDVVAFFSKNLQWKVIPHKDTTKANEVK